MTAKLLNSTLTREREAADGTHIYHEERKHGCAKAIRYTILSNGCWECISHHLNDRRTGNQYIQIHRRSRQLVLHRYIWELENGRYLKPWEVVRQKCGNPRCINPACLVLDGATRSNGYKRRKLRMKHARAIRREYWSNKSTTQRELAVKYQVSQSTIHNIISRKTYIVEPSPKLGKVA